MPQFVDAVLSLRARSPLSLYTGVEAKILDESGRLDLPQDLAGVDLILIADHRLPYGPRCLLPREARSLLDAEQVQARDLIDSLVRATCNSMRQPGPKIIAHLFSILPKCGLSEDQVEAEHLQLLAEAAIEHGAMVEISERWQCPSPRVLRYLAERGVSLVASTDAHDLDSVGRYDYVVKCLQALQAGTEDLGLESRLPSAYLAQPPLRLPQAIRPVNASG